MRISRLVARTKILCINQWYMLLYQRPLHIKQSYNLTGQNYIYQETDHNSVFISFGLCTCF